MQPPSRGHQLEFTPPSKGAELISVSPEDFDLEDFDLDFDLEGESMTLQSSRTGRTRFMKKNRYLRDQVQVGIFE